MTLDGTPIPSNPYEAEVTSDAANHRIGAQADGFAPREVQITLERDVSLDITLAPQGTGATISAPVQPSVGQMGVSVHAGRPAALPQRSIEEENPYKK